MGSSTGSPGSDGNNPIRNPAYAGEHWDGGLSAWQSPGKRLPLRELPCPLDRRLYSLLRTEGPHLRLLPRLQMPQVANVLSVQRAAEDSPARRVRSNRRSVDIRDRRRQRPTLSFTGRSQQSRSPPPGGSRLGP